MIDFPDQSHDAGGLNIGQKVRKYRKEATLSLDQLARLSSVSKAMLSQIEQNKTNPTIAVIWKIAKALNVSISDLVESVDTRIRFQVIRKEDERYIFINNTQCIIRTLSPLSLEKDIEFYQIDLQANGRLESEPHFHNTVEILTVAKGKLRVESADQTVVLQAGDSVYYCADVAHSITNAANLPARAYMVVKYRS
jgi:transcriptional regulator with XRE-family HTH domain